MYVILLTGSESCKYGLYNGLIIKNFKAKNDESSKYELKIIDCDSNKDI